MPHREQQRLRIFICHASQDKSIVRELYQRLLLEDWLDPWLDTKNLLPGQDWRIAIEQAVESADIIIVCLSRNSVNKEGAIQKELRYAREIALEKTEGTIFMIPILLEECNVPRGFRFLQWAKYFGMEKEQSYSDLLQALRLRQEQIILREAEMLAGRQAEEEAREKGELESVNSASKGQTESDQSVDMKILASMPDNEKTSRQAGKSHVSQLDTMEITSQTKYFDLVRVKGRVDSATAPKFSNTLKIITDAGRFNIVVDLADVEYLSSAGFRALLAVQRVCKRDGCGEVVLAGLPDTIHEAMELAGFLDLFRNVEDPKDAF